MNRLLYTLSAAALATFAACTTQPDKQTCNKHFQKNNSKIIFEHETYDFGPIPYADIVGHKFDFTNAGTQPLVIHNIDTGCPCTTVEYTQQAVQPGQKGSVRIIFDTKGLHGLQYKTILIHTNSQQTPTRISFTADVKLN